MDFNLTEILQYLPFVNEPTWEGAIRDLTAIALGAGLVVGGKQLIRYSKQENIAKVPLKGPIQSSGGNDAKIRGDKIITVDAIKPIIKKIKSNKLIKGCIFEIDSPGGEVTTTKEIADLINEIELPKVAVVKTYAASGGYFLASSCDKIIANEFSIIGSIGVLLQHIDYSGTMEKLGVKYDGIKSGEYKDFLMPFGPLEGIPREHLQEFCDHIHEKFIETVYEGRKGKMDLDKVKELANGLIYSSQDCLENGLIDQIGGEKEAIEYLKENTDIEKERIVTYNPIKRPFIFSLMGLKSYTGEMAEYAATRFKESLVKPDNQIKF